MLITNLFQINEFGVTVLFFLFFYEVFSGGSRRVDLFLAGYVSKRQVVTLRSYSSISVEGCTLRSLADEYNPSDVSVLSIYQITKTA